MSSLRICPVNYFDSDHAAISVSPAPLSTYPITNLQSNVSSDVWISASDANHVITGDFGGGARQISHFSVWPAPPDCLIGSQVRLRMWSDVPKTALVFDQTYDFFTPSGGAWGTFLWGIQNWGVDNADRTARLAPLVKWFTAVAVSAFEITFIRTGALEVHYFASRRIWLADYVEAPYNAMFGAAPVWQSGSVHRRTLGGSLRRERRAAWRELTFQTMFVSEVDRAAWSDLMNVADPASEIVLSLFPADANPHLERDYTVMGSLVARNPIVFENVNYHTLQVAIVES